MERIGILASTLGFMDIVAEGEDRGAGYVTDELRREAAARAQYVMPYAEAAAAWALGLYLEAQLHGVVLDREDPFSDASLSGALAGVLGVPVESVRDREKLKDAFKRATNERVSIELGYQFENIFDRNLLRRDVLRMIGSHAGEAVPGLVLSDLSSRERTRDDFLEYGRLRLSDLTGVNFQNLGSKQQIKEDIYAYVSPIIEKEILGEDGGESEYKRPLKMDTKSIRNREAQRRFRAARGECAVYEKVDNG